MNKKLTDQEMADLIAAEQEYFADPKNKPKRVKTLTVNMTKEEKEKLKEEKKLKDLIAAEQEYFNRKENKRKKFDPMDPEIYKRAKGGMVKKYAKGGEVKGYMDGGEVEVAMDDSPSSGMITQRGWGASRKT
jgi:hypothetical protein